MIITEVLLTCCQTPYRDLLEKTAIWTALGFILEKSHVGMSALCFSCAFLNFLTFVLYFYVLES